MLVLSRKLNETIIINKNIRVTVVGIRGSQVRIGIEAPPEVGIYREELSSQPRPSSEGPVQAVPSGGPNPVARSGR
jgi:carbon storage regulator